jgi:predicted transcriptional regulator
MNNAGIISIKPEYSSKILSGSKTIELRHSTLGLEKDDFVIVYESAPKQVLGFWFRIADVETYPIASMWTKYGGRLGIDHEGYLTYFDSCTEATGLHIGEVYGLNPPIPLAKIKELVPGFVPPQGILWIRDDIWRFKKLLSIISPQLPAEVLPQLCLFTDV